MKESMAILIPTASDADIIDALSPDPADNYSSILGNYNVPFRRADNYLEVGEPDWIQGWILDITVIKHQVIPLLETVLPLLIRENIPFTLARNSSVASSLLNGDYGYATLGKIISIYPRDNDQACNLARQLITLTASFKGPVIPTDRHLGSVLYTRYGAVNPIMLVNAQNIEEKYIYDAEGNLVRDPLTIPFHLPAGTEWPFEGIALPHAPKEETVLQDRYKPMNWLKEDCKGYVRKGLRLERFYRIKWCVIKEGKYAMLADRWNRDIHDRLGWQYELHKDLEGLVSIPKVYDLFRENENTYLIMDFIRGTSLNSLVSDMLNGIRWAEQSGAVRWQIMELAKKILDNIAVLHEKGYVHRDITPNNFMIDRHQRPWMIDVELTYSTRDRKPLPPHQLGTPGFMSPSQETRQLPTVEDDIYAIGGTLLSMVTGLLPYAFSTDDPALLTSQLIFFTGDDNLTKLIVCCMSQSPEDRPALKNLKTTLQKCQTVPSDSVYEDDGQPGDLSIQMGHLKNIISRALQGLSTKTFLNTENIWISKTEEVGNLSYSQSIATSVNPSFSEGLSGILYVLSKTHKAGFSIYPLKRPIDKSLAFIREKGNEHVNNSPGGLFTGTAGMALALISAIKSGLINSDALIEKDILSYLKNENTDGYGLSKGLAGRGMVLLSAPHTIADITVPILNQIVDTLLRDQQKDGSWIAGRTKINNTVKANGYKQGAAGIIIFLLKYLEQYKDTRIEGAVLKSLYWLMQQSRKINNERVWYKDNISKEIDTSLSGGTIGIILCFIRAYKIIKDPVYQQIAEQALTPIPEKWINRDLTLATGLSGIGETYLEAAQVFQSSVWEQRANWISQYFLHYYKQQKDGTIYWSTDGMPIPRVDLLNGNCGVLHFLMRLYDPGNFGHPLLLN